MRKPLAAVAVVALLSAALAVHFCRSGGAPGGRTSAEGGQRAALPTAWPRSDATLRPPALTFPPGFGTKRIFIDPGHGADGNTGNRSAFCQDEQDFTASLADGLARWLEQTGHFEVLLSRRPGEVVDYRERVTRAGAWRAAAFISLHSDVRGRSEPWAPDAGLSCPSTTEAPGFTVLWSDRGPGAIGVLRLTLARRLAARLLAAGFPAYDGAGYQGNYEGDGIQPGVFVDRHEPAESIFVLHAPVMPSVIVETHNAWYADEARRWEEPATREAFAAAVAAALTDVLR